MQLTNHILCRYKSCRSRPPPVQNWPGLVNYPPLQVEVLKRNAADMDTRLSHRNDNVHDLNRR